MLALSILTWFRVFLPFNYFIFCDEFGFICHIVVVLDLIIVENFLLF